VWRNNSGGNQGTYKDRLKLTVSRARFLEEGDTKSKVGLKLTYSTQVNREEEQDL